MSEMNDQVRAVVFIVLALIILFTWGHFFKPPVPVQPPSQTGTAQVAPTGGQATGASVRSSAANSSTTLSAGGKASAIPTVQATAEKNVTIESALYSVDFSNRGGVVRSWKLKRYLTDQKPPRPLDVVNADSAPQLGWPFSLVLTDPQLEAQANSALYEVTTSTGNAGATPLQAPADITFHWSDGHLDVTKKLSFNPDYELNVECDGDCGREARSSSDCMARRIWRQAGV